MEEMKAKQKTSANNWSNWNATHSKTNRHKYKSSKKIKKVLKVNFAIILIAIILGFGVGFASYSIICKNDKFTINTYDGYNIDVTIGTNEIVKNYEEYGATCVAFGKNVSTACKVKYMYRESLNEEAVVVDKVDISVPGMYYAIYTIDNFKYKQVELVRNIYVTGVEV